MSLTQEQIARVLEVCTFESAFAVIGDDFGAELESYGLSAMLELQSDSGARITVRLDRPSVILSQGFNPRSTAAHDVERCAADIVAMIDEAKRLWTLAYMATAQTI